MLRSLLLQARRPHSWYQLPLRRHGLSLLGTSFPWGPPLLVLIESCQHLQLTFPVSTCRWFILLRAWLAYPQIQPTFLSRCLRLFMLRAWPTHYPARNYKYSSGKKARGWWLIISILGVNCERHFIMRSVVPRLNPASDFCAPLAGMKKTKKN